MANWRNLAYSFFFFFIAMLLVKYMKGAFRIICVMATGCCAVGSLPLPLPVCSLDSGQWIRRVVMVFLMILQGNI